ncbi:MULTISPECIES: TonB-dependent receptor plug domain-containing protein [Methylosinus]|uniref:TonB-dependent receptor n=1 Tax=Methylosinus trichosporium (strain ATCC 35070 / NCIMB 11131 / UNIQEM 75 / OB3b) TaxID=595536 RepID=A0A2D2CZX0_METT3|nr:MULTISPECIES: TonB-dependent receptor [Methylosinus]ATQ68169.1 TonB-dependent receptor [Methylosinus trichosporium OB3b]OBS53434.1 TonB-dependent receptor [Methylosinus sp. 3S-1]
MSFPLSRSAVLGAPLFSASLLVILPALSFAQEALPSLEIGAATVVSADRVEEPASRAASAITVVSGKEVEKRGATGLLEVLRGTPGLDLYSSGGVGTQSFVYLRGATPGQTLVLIDGVRIGDPSSTDGSVDFGALVATDIERIEVLRGPQSALYGSNAMGGVIDIITRKGEGKLKGSVTFEGGSYGTIHTRASVSGSEGALWYAFAVDALHVDGFPRYGYRITRPLTIGDGVTPLPAAPSDSPTNKGGASARLGYRISEDLSVEASFIGYDNSIRFANTFAFTPADVFDNENHSHSSFGQGHVRIDADLFERRLHNRLVLFGNVIDRDIWQTSACFDASFSSFDCRTGMRGARRGLEYQGDLKLDALGLLTFGARLQTETVHTSQDPAPVGSFTPIDAAQTTHSGFAQHKFTVFDRLDLSYGGRIDAVAGNHTFGTWRTTAAYRLEETGTKFKASAGTGARIASLYQLFSQYGDPRLQPETSLGYDFGFDQTLFEDRVFTSLSLFENDFRQLIDYGSAPTCTATQVYGCYYNVGKAKTRGIEFSGEAALVPNEWRLKASYTHLVAQDLVKNVGLFRRPRDKGMAALVYSGFPGLELEARLNVVGPRIDNDLINSRRVTLSSYARLDLFADYKVNELLSVFARIENLNDARYEEIYNYGTAGRSAYGGIRMKW